MKTFPTAAAALLQAAGPSTHAGSGSQLPSSATVRARDRLLARSGMPGPFLKLEEVVTRTPSTYPQSEQPKRDNKESMNEVEELR